MTHIESRPSHTTSGNLYDFFVDCTGTIKDVNALKMHLEGSAHNVIVHMEEESSELRINIPCNILSVWAYQRYTNSTTNAM